MKQELIERLIRYAKVETQSAYEGETCPSTPGQLDLGRLLVEELKELGLSDAAMDANGYVMATLPANTDKPVPVIGFLAHVDTATDFTGTGVNPQVVDSYDGGDLVLNAGLNVVLSPKEFPELAGYKGHTLITTDGTTLLGADDKAGIANIMTALHHLTRHPEIKHGAVRVAFTPDEEIGRGPHKFDVAAFGAKFAYTVDGGPLGELEYESFNAASASIAIKGKSVHPGTAKNKMVNSLKIAMELNAKLPVNEAPEHTEGYEGFYHLNQLQGDVEDTKLRIFIRDFDRTSFEARKANVQRIVAELNAVYGEGTVNLKLEDQYYNMREKIEQVIEVVDIAKEAMKGLGIEPVIKPIRGGTDGSQLSYMGLPTPNLFTGGENYHGKYEYASVDVMEQSAKTIVEIIRLYAEKA
ncbi:peptidase T [Gorillibacterium sp. sgz500922]|uniref:peptidase T n=1 Tax=Gorillibacterium sp. sgz500922 TaxID=3446694 RepID=UPI003F670281